MTSLNNIEENQSANLLMSELWDIYTDNDTETSIKSNRVWDAIIKYRTQDRQAIATALVTALEELKTKDVDGKTYWGSHPDVIHDQALDQAKTIVTKLLTPTV